MGLNFEKYRHIGIFIEKYRNCVKVYAHYPMLKNQVVSLSIMNLFFSTKGAINRKQFLCGWLATHLIITALIVPLLAYQVYQLAPEMPLGMAFELVIFGYMPFHIACLACVPPLIANTILHIKRSRNIPINGWFNIIALIPILSIPYSLFLMIMPNRRLVMAWLSE